MEELVNLGGRTAEGRKETKKKVGDKEEGSEKEWVRE